MGKEDCHAFFVDTRCNVTSMLMTNTRLATRLIEKKVTSFFQKDPEVAVQKFDDVEETMFLRLKVLTGDNGLGLGQ